MQWSLLRLLLSPVNGCGMDWGTILANAGTPEPPGRAEAVEAMKVRRASKAAQAIEAKEEKKAKEAEKVVRAGMNLRARKKYI